jgi:hypothetical protein
MTGDCRATLGAVLAHPELFAWSDALYAPPGSVFTAALPVLVWDVDDVEDRTDLPAKATRLGYDYVLGIQDIQAVVANARDQRSAATMDDLLSALAHHLRADAYIAWG